MEVEKANELRELLEREANRGSDKNSPRDDEEQKGGQEDDDEEITTTRRRRLVKKVRATLADESDEEDDVKPAQKERRPQTGGRRLRRAATKPEKDDDEIKPATTDQKQELGDSVKKSENEGRKAARQGKNKRLRKPEKQQQQQADDNSYANAEADSAGEHSYGGDDEILRTPPSSHHASEDEDDQNDDHIVVAKKVTKGKMNKPAAAKKAPKKAKVEEVEAAANLVKSRNRLVGDIQNNDLYGDDDDVPLRDVVDEKLQREDEDGQVLDLGLGIKSNAPKKQFNFKNKAAAAETTDLNAKIQQLGFTRDVNMNELAARGVNLSLRDEIIRKFKNEQQQREVVLVVEDEAKEGETMQGIESVAPTNSASMKQTTLGNMVEKFRAEVKKLAPNQKVDQVMVEDGDDVNAQNGEDEDDGGLEFIDPHEVRKAELAEAAKNKEQNQKPKMVLINGQLVPTATVSLNGTNAQPGLAAAPSMTGRAALYSSIMDRVKQKTSKNFDLAQLQSTFKTQDLHSKKKEDVTVVDALAHELERGPADADGVDELLDDESDQDVGAEDAGSNDAPDFAQVEAPQHNWDDEENVKSITEGDLADCVQSSLDMHSQQARSHATPSNAVAKSVNDSMEEAEIAEALKSNESSMGATSMLCRKEIELEQLQQQQAAAVKKKKRSNVASRFIDDEADLGSDNEENDDRVKRINKEDFEEDEEGLDDSLDGFVEHGPVGDDEEIAAGNEAARDLYLARQAQEEEDQIKKTIGAVFYGQNKKRKRGEIEFDDLDDQQKIYFKRREERLQNELLEEEEEDDLKAAEEAAAVVELKEQAEEDEMSEEEIQNQLEQQKMFRWRRQMKQIGEEELYNRYTNVQAKQKAENDQLDNLIIDTTQTRTVATPSFANSTHGTNSLVSTKSKEQQPSTCEQTQVQAVVRPSSRRKPVPQKLIQSGATMLDKKKFVISSSDSGMTGMNDKTSMISTGVTSKTSGYNQATGLRNMLRAKRQFAGNSSMMNLVKTQENQGAGVAAKTKKPMIFGAFKH